MKKLRKIFQSLREFFGGDPQEFLVPDPQEKLSTGGIDQAVDPFPGETPGFSKIHSPRGPVDAGDGSLNVYMDKNQLHGAGKIPEGVGWDGSRMEFTNLPSFMPGPEECPWAKILYDDKKGPQVFRCTEPRDHANNDIHIYVPGAGTAFDLSPFTNNEPEVINLETDLIPNKAEWTRKREEFRKEMKAAWDSEDEIVGASIPPIPQGWVYVGGEDSFPFKTMPTHLKGKGTFTISGGSVSETFDYDAPIGEVAPAMQRAWWEALTDAKEQQDVEMELQHLQDTERSASTRNRACGEEADAGENEKDERNVARKMEKPPVSEDTRIPLVWREHSGDFYEDGPRNSWHRVKAACSDKNVPMHGYNHLSIDEYVVEDCDLVLLMKQNDQRENRVYTFRVLHDISGFYEWDLHEFKTTSKIFSVINGHTNAGLAFLSEEVEDDSFCDFCGHDMDHYSHCRYSQDRQPDPFSVIDPKLISEMKGHMKKTTERKDAEWKLSARKDDLSLSNQIKWVDYSFQIHAVETDASREMSGEGDFWADGVRVDGGRFVLLNAQNDINEIGLYQVERTSLAPAKPGWKLHKLEGEHDRVNVFSGIKYGRTFWQWDEPVEEIITTSTAGEGAKHLIADLFGPTARERVRQFVKRAGKTIVDEQEIEHVQLAPPVVTLHGEFDDNLLEQILNAMRDSKPHDFAQGGIIKPKKKAKAQDEELLDKAHEVRDRAHGYAPHDIKEVMQVEEDLLASEGIDINERPGFTQKMDSAFQWRVGRKLRRTIYVQRGIEPSDDDECIGMMDTPSLALDVVVAHNSFLSNKVAEKVMGMDSFAESRQWTRQIAEGLGMKIDDKVTDFLASTVREFINPNLLVPNSEREKLSRLVMSLINWDNIEENSDQPNRLWLEGTEAETALALWNLGHEIISEVDKEDEAKDLLWKIENDESLTLDDAAKILDIRESEEEDQKELAELQERDKQIRRWLERNAPREEQESDFEQGFGQASRMLFEAFFPGETLREDCSPWTVQLVPRSGAFGDPSRVAGTAIYSVNGIDAEEAIDAATFACERVDQATLDQTEEIVCQPKDGAPGWIVSKFDYKKDLKPLMEESDND